MSLLDIDNTINDIQPIFNSAIINLIKSKKTDMICWLDWKVETGFYRYNTLTRQLETALYDFDPENWFIYQLWGTQTIFICKHYLVDMERRIIKASPLRLYGSCSAISLEKLMELVNK